MERLKIWKILYKEKDSIHNLLASYVKWFYLNLKYHDNTQLCIKPTGFLVKSAHWHYIDQK